MSFSSQIKEELSKVNNLARKNEVEMELIGYLISSNTSKSGNKIKFSTESEYNINRYAKLLKNCNIDDYKIDIKGKKYGIEHKVFANFESLIFKDKTLDVIKHKRGEQEDKSFVRGAFLGGGYINNPEKKYHMEINFSTEQNLSIVCRILEDYNINTKKLVKEKSFTMYIKDGEEISKILAFMGANRSVLKFEEVRVIRDSSNKLNRLVNCGTANFSKTIVAGKKQIDDIKFIKSKKKFSELAENLQEIANIRLKYPEASLSEIVNIMGNTISKSGVMHRLAAISKFADELRNNR